MIRSLRLGPAASHSVGSGPAERPPGGAAGRRLAQSFGAPGNPARTVAADVSRRHARILVAGDRVTIEDLGSKNGTLVNGEPATRPVVLNDLDVVVLGTVRLIVRAAEAAAETETAER